MYYNHSIQERVIYLFILILKQNYGTQLKVKISVTQRKTWKTKYKQYSLKIIIGYPFPALIIIFPWQELQTFHEYFHYSLNALQSRCFFFFSHLWGSPFYFLFADNGAWIRGRSSITTSVLAKKWSLTLQSLDWASLVKDNKSYARNITLTLANNDQTLIATRILNKETQISQNHFKSEMLQCNNRRILEN